MSKTEEGKSKKKMKTTKTKESSHTVLKHSGLYSELILNRSVSQHCRPQFNPFERC